MDISEELSRFEVGSIEHKFFEKVFDKLGPNFVRSSVEDELRESHNNLNSAMQSYFQSHIFASAVSKSAEQLEVSKETDSSSSSIPSLYLNFVQKYLPSGVSEKPNFFGLSQELILKAIRNKKSEAETATLKKLVEDNINDFCIKLIQCVGGTVVSDGDWKNAFDRTMKDLEYKATLLSCEETKQRSKKQLRDMIKTYYEELSKGVLLLNTLLSLHSRKLEFESDLAKYYLLRCHAVFLKVRVFEQKLLEATYDQETISALKKISAQLDQTEQKLKEEQNEKAVALEQYLKLGKEYEHFVDEYSRLMKSIKEEQWAVDELKNKKLQYASNCS